MYKIEKNIIPQDCTKHQDVFDAINKLEIGDSFELDFTEAKRKAIFRIAQKIGYKITTRIISTEKMRVWRVK